MNMEWLNSTPDLTWLQLILISFIGNLCGSLLCTYIDRYEAKKNKKKENDKAEYEPIKFELIPAFTFCGKKIRAMTYTPDFVGDNFIIEAKGRPNDVWPYKWKWFMWSLLNKGLAEKYKLFVVHNHKETDECIRRIQEL